MPTLFSTVWFNLPRFLCALPDALLPHIKTIVFVGVFSDMGVQDNHGSRSIRGDKPLKVHLFSDALQRFPRLQSLVLRTGGGLPHRIVAALFSLPRIREIRINDYLCLSPSSDATIPPKTRLTGCVPHQLVSFSNTRYEYYPYRTPFPGMDLVSLVMQKAAATVETIKLTGEAVPERTFRKNDWPRLRELVIRGERPVLRHPRSMTMLSVCARMPNLRVLKLELAQSSEMKRCALWPKGWTAGCPWPNLEVLTVTYPDPDDRLFSQLPRTLHQLSLRCYPRHHILLKHSQTDPFLREKSWTAPVPTAGEILRILRHCAEDSSAQLTHLDVEFKSDEHDGLLMRYIGASFHALVFLQLHGYSLPEESRPFPTTVGSALSSLSSLRVLRLGHGVAGSFQIQQCQEAVLMIARSLSISARFICILWSQRFVNRWVPFCIVRNEAGDAVDVVYDRSITAKYGYPCDDEHGPLPVHDRRRR